MGLEAKKVFPLLTQQGIMPNFTSGLDLDMYMPYAGLDMPYPGLDMPNSVLQGGCASFPGMPPALPGCKTTAPSIEEMQRKIRQDQLNNIKKTEAEQNRQLNEIKRQQEKAAAELKAANEQKAKIAEQQKQITQPAAEPKMGFWDKAKAFGAGPLKSIKGMFCDQKGFSLKRTAITVGVTAAAIGADILSGGTLTPVLVGAGVAMGGYGTVKGVVAANSAKNNKELENAYEEIGSGVFDCATSVIGLKGASAIKGAKSAGKIAAIEDAISTVKNGERVASTAEVAEAAASTAQKGVEVVKSASSTAEKVAISTERTAGEVQRTAETSTRILVDDVRQYQREGLINGEIGTESEISESLEHIEQLEQKLQKAKAELDSAYNRYQASSTQSRHNTNEYEEALRGLENANNNVNALKQELAAAKSTRAPKSVSAPVEHPVAEEFDARQYQREGLINGEVGTEAEIPAPAAQTPAPVAETPAPVVETPAPVVQASTPVATASKGLNEQAEKALLTALKNYKKGKKGSEKALDKLLSDEAYSDVRANIKESTESIRINSSVIDRLQSTREAFAEALDTDASREQVLGAIDKVIGLTKEGKSKEAASALKEFNKLIEKRPLLQNIFENTFSTSKKHFNFDLASKARQTSANVKTALKTRPVSVPFGIVTAGVNPAYISSASQNQDDFETAVQAQETEAQTKLAQLDDDSKKQGQIIDVVNNKSRQLDELNKQAKINSLNILIEKASILGIDVSDIDTNSDDIDATIDKLQKRISK